MRNERTTELLMCPHGVLRLRINGEPMRTAIIDREEARALIRELQEWLEADQREIDGLLDAAMNNFDYSRDVRFQLAASELARATDDAPGIFPHLLAITRTQEFIRRYEVKLAALKGGK